MIAAATAAVPHRPRWLRRDRRTMGLYQISSMMVALDKTPLPPGVKPYFQ